ncbi:HAMP domain-containing histidine kinase [Patescibacteria group bacterium]|nr:HAMP domain-containing histidine kinase [Patescibacteria group bacterium]
MIISGLFSLAAYQNMSQELARSIHAFRRIRLDIPMFDTGEGTFIFESDQQLFNEARTRLALDIGLTNLVILVVAGGASYFLAGKTLAPIERMVEEQKRFISDASHELRTPLTALKTEIEVALREKRISSQEAREMLESNLEEVNKMQMLSNYLLSLNRYQNKTVPLPMDKVPLKSVMEKAIKQVQRTAATKQMKIKKNLQEAAVWGNEMSLVELFVIFLDNAIKYSQPGSAIEISLQPVGNYAVAEISDQGMGIDQKDLPHIFDRFYRADLSRSKIKTDGYGLGLAIAKNIIDLHQGRVEVESILEKGSKFTIFLPTRT